MAMVQLPAEGRQGEAPGWPLPRDVRSEKRLELLNERIDDLSMDAQGADRKAQAAQRKLLAVREEAEVLEQEIAHAADEERKLWVELWATPQAVMWERSRWTREVALYVRHMVRAQFGDLDSAKEARMQADRLGLNPQALLRLRWEVVEDETATARSDRGGRVASRGSARGRLKAVDAGDASTG